MPKACMALLPLSDVVPLSSPMARACGAAVSETPATDAVTAAAAHSFFMVVPFREVRDKRGVGMRTPPVSAAVTNPGTRAPVAACSPIGRAQRALFGAFGSARADDPGCYGILGAWRSTRVMGNGGG
ncbi:hypothetical protein SCWH03_26630 [Streptomyces pacificus]|uniref:Uncharacterized protein n=1 Tax=Streptomyces pacificus TaxID=2705029 RepID=A0A6A0AVI5_9ACTN|nr:hypothetical protein SCWH03_26630 [Streptomyces pacificus]